jgi:hypothetical protein
MRRSPLWQGCILASILVLLVSAAAIALRPGGASGSRPGFGHVFLIVGENASLRQITPRHAPYLTGEIKPRAAWLTRYHAVASGSLADYVAMLSGQYVACHRRDAPPVRRKGRRPCHQNVDNLYRQLDVRRVSWLQWNESAARPCDMSDHGVPQSRNTYVAHHSPALYFDSVQRRHSSPTVAPSRECREKVVSAGTTGPNDMSAFEAALATGEVARFNLVIPNNCENGHDRCGNRDRIRQFDDFLAREIPLIEASPAFDADATIIVTWDEGAHGARDALHVLLAAVGRQVRPGVYGGARYTHYSLLRTLEDGFGITHHLRRAARARAITGIWR